MLLIVPAITPEIQALLARAMFPNPARISHTIREYQSQPDWHVFAWQRSGQIVSAAGIKLDKQQAEILHIGTNPEASGKGYGRSLLEAVIQELNLTQVTAETDDNAVEFYRKIGFEIVEIPNEWGTRRYLCTLAVSQG